MRMTKLAPVLVAIAMLSIPVVADIYAPSHSCSKPHKPYFDSDEFSQQLYLNDVSNYKQCIVDFVEQQNHEISIHQRAADDAIEEWNRFARMEL